VNKVLRSTIEKDLFRYWEGNIPWKDRLFVPPEVKYIVTFRKAQFYAKNKLLSYFYRFRLRRLSYKTQIQIPHNTQIGEGFYIGHLGRIIINPGSVLGRNINIATGVTIGAANRGPKKGCPTIGSSVWIGTNAVIVGKISIGDDVLIAPNSYVNYDIPSHSVAIGNPVVVHHRENACESYINRTI